MSWKSSEEMETTPLEDKGTKRQMSDNGTDSEPKKQKAANEPAKESNNRNSETVSPKIEKKSNDKNDGKQSNSPQKNKPAEEKKPTERCPICLAQVTNRAILDPCFHAFCYQCIRQSMRRANHCPVCRQDTVRIMYNIRSDNEFDSFAVQSPLNWALVHQLMDNTMHGDHAHLIAECVLRISPSLDGFTIETENLPVQLVRGNQTLTLSANNVHNFPVIAGNETVFYGTQRQPLNGLLNQLRLHALITQEASDLESVGDLYGVQNMDIDGNSDGGQSHDNHNNDNNDADSSDRSFSGFSGSWPDNI